MPPGLLPPSPSPACQQDLSPLGHCTIAFCVQNSMFCNIEPVSSSCSGGKEVLTVHVHQLARCSQADSPCSCRQTLIAPLGDCKSGLDLEPLSWLPTRQCCTLRPVLWCRFPLGRSAGAPGLGMDPTRPVDAWMGVRGRKAVSACACVSPAECHLQAGGSRHRLFFGVVSLHWCCFCASQIPTR